MAYAVMACIVMAYAVMAYIVMAYIVMASEPKCSASRAAGPCVFLCARARAHAAHMLLACARMSERARLCRYDGCDDMTKAVFVEQHGTASATTGE